MSRRKPLRNWKPKDMRHRLMAEENQNQAAITATANNESPPRIFKLNTDCTDEVFDLLTLKDIHSMGETCKTMQLVAGEYFHWNFIGTRMIYVRAAKLRHSEFRGGNYWVEFRDRYFNFDATGFPKFIQKIVIFGHRNENEDFRLIGKSCESLKDIYFSGVSLDATKIELIKTVLDNVEVLNLCHVKLDGETYENFLQFCPKLKRLCITNIFKPSPKRSLIGTSKEWTQRNYPTLEHLGLELRGSPLTIDWLTDFFDRNPHLKSFAVNYSFFLANINLFFQVKVKLDVFTLEINSSCSSLEAICPGLNQLHKQGFYKRLHLNYDSTHPKIDKTVQGLEMLTISQKIKEFRCKSLASLKEFAVLSLFLAELFSKELVNIERLYIRRSTPVIIKAFVQNSSKLKVIKINEFDRYNNDFFSLSEWNRERRKLPGANKVTIYAEEKTYLKIKWATKGETFDMVDIKRADLCDWNPIPLRRDEWFKN